jgi:hypothetical protein
MAFRVRESETEQVRCGGRGRPVVLPGTLSLSLPGEEQVAMTCRPAGSEPHVSVTRGDRCVRRRGSWLWRKKKKKR